MTKFNSQLKQDAYITSLFNSEQNYTALLTTPSYLAIISPSVTLSLCHPKISILIVHVLILFPSKKMTPAKTCPSEAMPLCLYMYLLLPTGLLENLAVTGSISGTKDE